MYVESDVSNSILVIIPAFNEEAVLNKTLDALHREIPSIQILVVSDGSTDKTSQIVLDKRLELLELPFNLGVGVAMRSGFQYAKKMDTKRSSNLMLIFSTSPKILKR